MGGWETIVTQETVIRPSTVGLVLKTMKSFIDDFNKYLEEESLSERVQLGFPTGSSAHYETDFETQIYGDIDLQLIVPNANISGYSLQQMWFTLLNDFIKSEKLKYIHSSSYPGHPVIQIGENDWVQVDLMIHQEYLAKWGRYRTTAQPGIKGLLNGNLFSVLGQMFNMSIQHSGVQLKLRNNTRCPFNIKKDYELVTVSTDIEHFVKDIFDYEYQLTGKNKEDCNISPLLEKYQGVDVESTSIKHLVNAIKGLAESFELNGMFGPDELYKSYDEFIEEFLNLYENKAHREIASSKRDKASTESAIKRAENERIKIYEGLKYVMELF